MATDGAFAMLQDIFSWISSRTIVPLCLVLCALVGMAPLLVVAVGLLPAWLTWPWMADERQKNTLALIQALAKWSTGLLAAAARGFSGKGPRQ
ncbi:hypothetical protein OIE69_43605 (plasmid) [Actinacidiphila glaucinigra]|uniref:hypothetical protein n=1 Tax=Actinacidiphila glaucinigra TaxID=235986 RepID=UPI002DD80148|nr:hypothetical protein [Actinacidiphila glaucinigra]WSD65796.1 hypothetical protein OIE69_43605 [Actinacidiphila glaucinigra]